MIRSKRASLGAASNPELDLVFCDEWSVLGRDAVNGDPCRGRAACHGDPCRGRAACSGGIYADFNETASFYLQVLGHIPSVDLPIQDLLRSRIAALQK
jgi:hypothetical protein